MLQPANLQDDNKVKPVADPKDVPKGAKRDSRNRLVYEGFPDFRPTLTPKQVLSFLIASFVCMLRSQMAILHEGLLLLVFPTLFKG